MPPIRASSTGTPALHAYLGPVTPAVRLDDEHVPAGSLRRADHERPRRRPSAETPSQPPRERLCVGAHANAEAPAGADADVVPRQVDVPDPDNDRAGGRAVVAGLVRRDQGEVVQAGGQAAAVDAAVPLDLALGPAAATGHAWRVVDE